MVSPYSVDFGDVVAEGRHLVDQELEEFVRG